MLGRFAIASCGRDLADETMQPDAIREQRGIAFVRDWFAID
jgi:hypothetical protein